jgi:type I restriction-modification system DNA methylase subunit
LEQGLVEAVIELPKQLFVESAIPVALVVFSFGNETVRFVNLADCYTETRGLNVMDVPKALTIWNEADGRSVIEVDRSAILANDAILIAKKYLANNLLPDVDSVPLGDLCLDLFRGAQLSSRVLNDIAVDENNADRAVLTLASLDEVLINNHREYIKTTDRNYDRYLIQDNDILITSRGTAQRINLAHLKPDEQVIASGNLIVLRPDPEQVHPLYVYAVLASDIGRTLLASVTKEGTIASIDPNGLRSIRIPMIDEEKQYQVAHKIERLTDRFRSLQRELIETSSRITTLFDQESMEE